MNITGSQWRDRSKGNASLFKLQTCPIQLFLSPKMSSCPWSLIGRWKSDKQVTPEMRRKDSSPLTAPIPMLMCIHARSELIDVELLPVLLQFESNPKPHSQAGPTKGWVGMGTNWWKCLWDKVTSVPRSHLCRENSEEAASHLSANWQIQQILHLVSFKHIFHFHSQKTVRGLLHTYLRTVRQLNIVFDESLDHNSCFTYHT